MNFVERFYQAHERFIKISPVHSAQAIIVSPDVYSEMKRRLDGTKEFYGGSSIAHFMSLPLIVSTQEKPDTFRVV